MGIEMAIETNIATENGPVEIVDFPSYKMVDLSIASWMILGNAPLGVKSWMAF